MLFNPKATFSLARQLQTTEGAPLGEVFSFVSGLYFRGKMTYGLAFGKGPPGVSGALVISAGSGLRFLHEPVTLERLQAWADVSIEAGNPDFVQPLVAHSVALRSALGETARFVLLGSVATDKYVRPLLEVFGERLFFPSDFPGRGDMSRGGLLLRAAREGRELPYVPLASAKRHGPRPARLSERPVPPDALEQRGPELVILIGLPGAGKSTFFQQRFGSTHAHVSKDNLEAHRRDERHDALLREALGRQQSVVVDNTNVTLAQRAPLIAAARRHGVRVVGYYFESTTQECVNRNFGREGRARIPVLGIFAAAKRLVPPTAAEGFDELYTVRTLTEQRFDVRPRDAGSSGTP
jgi:hypothetical protein